MVVAGQIASINLPENNSQWGGGGIVNNDGDGGSRTDDGGYAIIEPGSDGPGKHATSGPGVIWTKHISPTDPGHLIATSIILIQPRDPGRMVLHLLLFVVSTKYSTY